MEKLTSPSLHNIYTRYLTNGAEAHIITVGYVQIPVDIIEVPFERFTLKLFPQLDSLGYAGIGRKMHKSNSN